MTALEKYNQRALSANSLVCVGLDPEITKLPAQFQNHGTPQFAFNQWIIDQTAEYAAAFKPQLAYYEARGAAGIAELQMTCDYLRSEYPEHLIIADAKRADIGSTNQGYISFFYEQLQVDAITLQPYLGSEALAPFLKYPDKLSIVLCRTSNPGSGEFQDLLVDGQPLWSRVAQQVTTEWSKVSECALVVGATYDQELAQLRQQTGDTTFLVPGIGAQGGSVEKVIKVGLNSEGLGLIINSARGIIFAANPGQEAKNLQTEINTWRT